MSEVFAKCRRWIPYVLSLERNYKRLTHDLCQGEVVADSLELSEDLADLLGHAGWYLYEIGQTATATAILLTARKICEDLHGETPNATTAFIYTNLSYICNANNNFEQAIKLDEIAIRFREVVLGENNVETGNSYTNYAIGLAGLDKPEERHEYFEKAVRVQESSAE
ncbi:MAG: hypothetical protein Q9163_003041 [Psora crenata]